MQLNDIVDLERFALGDAAFIRQCRETLDRDGVLVLPDFLRADALAMVHAESVGKQDRAYFCAQNHSVYLTPHNAEFGDDHPANRQVVSSKGCICDDEVAEVVSQWWDGQADSTDPMPARLKRLDEMLPDRSTRVDVEDAV